jgi:hypothetical protein
MVVFEGETVDFVLLLVPGHWNACASFGEFRHI